MYIAILDDLRQQLQKSSINLATGRLTLASSPLIIFIMSHKMDKETFRLCKQSNGKAKRNLLRWHIFYKRDSCQWG